MQLFPNRKTYIQFIGYTKLISEMDATKNYIVQVLRQNGCTEVSDQWNFWYHHTAIKAVHYGQSGANGANFYIPSFRKPQIFCQNLFNKALFSLIVVILSAIG